MLLWASSVNWRATPGLFLCFGNELKAIWDASNRMLTLRSSVSNPLVVKSDRDLSTPNSHPAAARRAMPGRPLAFTHWQWQHLPLFYIILFNQNTFSGIMIQDGNMGWLWESGAQICKEPYHLSYIGAKHRLYRWLASFCFLYVVLSLLVVIVPGSQTV